MVIRLGGRKGEVKLGTSDGDSGLQRGSLAQTSSCSSEDRHTADTRSSSYRNGEE